MLIRIDPYYCPHCDKFKKRRDVYKACGSQTVDYVRFDGYFLYCRDCDTPVEKVKLILKSVIREVVRHVVAQQYSDAKK